MKRNVKILIAEDDAISLAYLQEVLREWNIYTVLAADGAEALDYCRRDNEIALVLMDIKMPVLGGIEATEKIKALRPELPVIAQTAYALNEERSHILKKGFDDYLSKPIRRQDLIKIMNTYLPGVFPA